MFYPPNQTFRHARRWGLLSMNSFGLFLKKRPGKICGNFLAGTSELRERKHCFRVKVKCFCFFLVFGDEHERQFMRERGMDVCRNHKKSFLGPGSNLAALGLITGLQPGCPQGSCMISSSAKWAVYVGQGKGVYRWNSLLDRSTNRQLVFDQN